MSAVLLCCCCCCCCGPSLGHLPDWISAGRGRSRWAVTGQQRGTCCSAGALLQSSNYTLIDTRRPFMIPASTLLLKVFTIRGPNRKTIIGDIIHCSAPHNDHTVVGIWDKWRGGQGRVSHVSRVTCQPGDLSPSSLPTTRAGRCSNSPSGR